MKGVSFFDIQCLVCMAVTATKSSLPAARLPSLDRLRLTAIRAAERDEHGAANLFVIGRGIAERFDMAWFSGVGHAAISI